MANVNIAFRLHKELTNYINENQGLIKEGICTQEELRQKGINYITNKWRTVCEIKESIVDPIYEEICGTYCKQKYFITLRPPPELSLNIFITEINKILTRKCFKSYMFSLEQKGTTLETLGEGFHTHIICDVTQRSKGELLRDIKSSIKQYIPEQGIDIRPIRTKQESDNFLGYIKNYTSKDGHKELTKEWDILWRKKFNFKALYDCELIEEIPIPKVTSPVTFGNSNITLTF